VGVPIYSGSRISIPHASENYFALYATCEGLPGGSDGAKFYKPAFSAMTFQISGPGIAKRPWNTLEQPSLAFCYGVIPGTITLNHWTSMSGRLKPTVALRDPGVRPRDVGLATIIDRLIYLEAGFEEDDEDVSYKNLYKVFLKDPDRFLRPHKAMEKQIADLIFALSGPQWIDFSDPRNHIVGNFLAGASYGEEDRYKKFFHQLLLSLELDLRINSKHHAEEPKQKLLSQLPPRIAWDLALSRKWRECMSIRKSKLDYSKRYPIEIILTIKLTDSIVKFHLRVRKWQVKALRKFARAMKWPNLAEVDEIMKSKDRVRPLESRSADAMSYFSGFILPGPTLPFLLMNTLRDCNRDSELGALTHMYPQCGFQYRSTTYWSSTCIVGRVLAPQCREIAGWIGPAMSTPDLERAQIVNIRQRRPRQKLSPGDVKSMTARSDPLGPPPPTQSYPVKEYQLVLPDLEDIPNTIRIEKLALRPAPSETTPKDNIVAGPKLYDACVQFAISGTSWPLRLAFDVSYISAYPCAGGPHPLFYDYVYKAVKVDEILTMEGWGGSAGLMNTSVSGGDSSEQISNARGDDNDGERVLVVEAFGVPDNEILARAWASHWGLSSIIADVRKTW
jgi:hypothetical protein